MMNTFLIIVGDSFMEAREQGKFDWIKNRHDSKQG